MTYTLYIETKKAKTTTARKYPYGELWLTTNQLAEKAGKPFSAIRHMMTRYNLSPKEAVERIRARNARH